MTDVNDLIFSPADIASLTEEYLGERRRVRELGGLQIGMPLYIKSLDSTEGSDEGFVPLQDGDLAVIISRPGHGKSSMMMRWARKRCWEIRKRAAMGDEDAKRRVVVYATWEQTVEALNSFHVAATNTEINLSITRMAKGEIDNDQWKRIQAANILRTADPLWYIGHSIKRRKKRPTLDATTLAESLWSIENWGGDNNEFRIDSVFVDYLQKVPWDKSAESKTVGISGNLDRFKDGALALATKFIVGCQGKRELDKRDDPTPQQEDGEWTANIEQSADVIISTVRPCKYRDQGENYNGVTVNGFKQMLVTVCKQKVGESNFCKWVDFDPRYNKLDEVDMRHYEVRNYTDKD